MLCRAGHNLRMILKELRESPCCCAIGGVMPFANAMVYALATMEVRKPLHLYLGAFGLVAFPIYLAIQVAEYICGR